MMQEVVDLLEGDLFIAWVVIDGNGYNRIKQMFPVSEPPEDYISEADLEAYE